MTTNGVKKCTSKIKIKPDLGQRRANHDLFLDN